MSLPAQYDAVAVQRELQVLRQRLEELEARPVFQEAFSLEGRAGQELQEGRLYYRVDQNRINVDIVAKLRGRLHRIALITSESAGSTGGVAPADARYVVSAADADLPNADVLTGTANQITVSSGLLATPQDIHTAATPQFARLGLGAAAHGTKSINAANGAIFADNVNIDADSKALTLGADQDATLQYDGTNLLVNPKAVGSGRAEVQGDLKVTGQVGFNNTNPVAQSTGWAVTNVTEDKTFDANSTSTDELADVLGTLITYLLSRGDLGA